MSGISGDRADGNWAGRDTRRESWEELSSNNERLVQMPGAGAQPAGAGSGAAARWGARRGQLDMRQVVSAA